MSLSIQPRARAIFIWVALIPVSLACLTYWTRIQFKQTVARVSHTERVLGAIDDIVDAITSAETGQRGFLLTGQSQYVKPFESAQRDLPLKMTALRALLAGNSSQLPYLDRLQKLVHEKLAELKQTVDLGKQGERGEALAIVRSNRGLQAMEDIIQVSQEMTTAENLRLQ